MYSAVKLAYVKHAETPVIAPMYTWEPLQASPMLPACMHTYTCMYMCVILCVFAVVSLFSAQRVL